MGDSACSRTAASLFGGRIRLIVAASVSLLLYGASVAQSMKEYEYDAAGRLRKVVAPQMDAAYVLDAAGNRTSVANTTGHGVPSSIVVPPSSTTGTYTIDWGVSSSTSTTRYELYEATNSSFAGAVLRYDGSLRSASFTTKPDGTYYYRVRACDPAGCGPHLPGANPISVVRPLAPNAPGPMSIPSGDIDGTYQIGWGAVAPGSFTAYELYEAINGGSFGATPIYSNTTNSTTVSGRGNGTYSYRVRACNDTSCSAYTVGTNSVAVTLPPGVPGAVVVPAYNNSGNYTVSWGASTGVVTAYEALESNMSGESLVYSGTAASLARSGKPDDVYSYRVRACNGPACGAYTSAQGMAGVIYVDKIAPTPPTTISALGNGTIYWTGGSQDSAGAGAGSGVGSWNLYRNGSYLTTTVLPTQSYLDQSAPGNTTLNYVVRSVDRAGNESAPSPTYTTYIDTIPPTTPGNFRVTATTTGSVSLAWDASTDAFGIGWYEIRRSPGGYMGNGNASTTYVDATVSSNTTYTYEIDAVDNHGVHSSPASLTVTTPAGAPSVPVMNGASFTQDHDGVYTISWQASTGAVAYYVLEEQSGGPWNPTTVTGTSRGFTQGGGEYAYRVKACTSGAVCSGYSSTRTIAVCIGGCP